MSKMLRVVLIDIAHPHYHIDQAIKDLGELQSLVAAYGGIDVVRIIQHRTRPDNNTFIGSGKVRELVEIVKRETIDCIIINSMANPTQLFNLTSTLWPVNVPIQVWDRIDLILNIFDKHAHTAEAKLQIEIARLRHMGPRIYGLGGTYFSRQGAGIGTRGLGETNIELMKRHYRREIKKKQEELAKLENHRHHQLQRRRDNGLKTVSIIGYTNAGKTSLFNILTGKNKTIADMPFVTLDSSVGKLQLNSSNQSVVLSDTIGFIQNLPSHLIETFKSTLMEAVESDLLLQVIDISDEKIKEKMAVVESVLSQLKISNKKRIYVFNKTDQLNGQIEKFGPLLKKKFYQFSPIFISLKENQGVNDLRKQITEMLV